MEMILYIRITGRSRKGFPLAEEGTRTRVQKSYSSKIRIKRQPFEGESIKWINGYEIRRTCRSLPADY